MTREKVEGKVTILGMLILDPGVLCRIKLGMASDELKCAWR
jgi:hypothetical protein